MNRDIAPSILSADFSILREEIIRLDKAGAAFVHLDSMDGNFVPNITFGAQIIKSIRPFTTMMFDSHLMINDPLRYVDDYIEAGSDIVTIHFEACGNVEDVLKIIRLKGAKCGLSIKPGTSVDEISHLLGQVDIVLVMSVEPGFGGQNFIPSALEKISSLAELKKEHGYEYIIEIDGGINKSTIIDAADAGAELFVIGSAFFKDEDYSASVKLFRDFLSGNNENRQGNGNY